MISGICDFVCVSALRKENGLSYQHTRLGMQILYGGTRHRVYELKRSKVRVTRLSKCVAGVGMQVDMTA